MRPIYDESCRVSHGHTSVLSDIQRFFVRGLFCHIYTYIFIGLFCLHKRDLYMTKAVESITDMHLFCQMYSLLLSEVTFSIYIYVYRSLLSYIGLFCHMCTYVYVSFVIYTYIFIGLLWT